MTFDWSSDDVVECFAAYLPHVSFVGTLHVCRNWRKHGDQAMSAIIASPSAEYLVGSNIEICKLMIVVGRGPSYVIGQAAWCRNAQIVRWSVMKGICKLPTVWDLIMNGCLKNAIWAIEHSLVNPSIISERDLGQLHLQGQSHVRDLFIYHSYLQVSSDASMDCEGDMEFDEVDIDVDWTDSRVVELIVKWVPYISHHSLEICKAWRIATINLFHTLNNITPLIRNQYARRVVVKSVGKERFWLAQTAISHRLADVVRWCARRKLHAFANICELLCMRFDEALWHIDNDLVIPSNTTWYLLSVGVTGLPELVVDRANVILKYAHTYGYIKELHDVDWTSHNPLGLLMDWLIYINHSVLHVCKAWRAHAKNSMNQSMSSIPHGNIEFAKACIIRFENPRWLPNYAFSTMNTEVVKWCVEKGMSEFSTAKYYIESPTISMDTIRWLADNSFITYDHVTLNKRHDEHTRKKAMYLYSCGAIALTFYD